MNIENQTNEYKSQMNYFQITLEGKWKTTSLDLTGQYRDEPKNNVLFLEDEGKEFTNEFRLVIRHNKMKYSHD